MVKIKKIAQNISNRLTYRINSIINLVKKKKKSVKKHINYSPETLELAIDEVKKGLTYREASEKYDIHYYHMNLNNY